MSYFYLHMKNNIKMTPHPILFTMCYFVFVPNFMLLTYVCSYTKMSFTLHKLYKKPRFFCRENENKRRLKASLDIANVRFMYFQVKCILKLKCILSNIIVTFDVPNKIAGRQGIADHWSQKMLRSAKRKRKFMEGRGK